MKVYGGRLLIQHVISIDSGVNNTVAYQYRARGELYNSGGSMQDPAPIFDICRAWHDFVDEIRIDRLIDRSITSYS